MDKNDKKMLFMLAIAVVVIALLLLTVRNFLGTNGGVSFFTFFDNAGAGNAISSFDKTKNYQLLINTSEGNITVDLDTKAAPLLTKQFYDLSKQNFFNNSRVSGIDDSIGIFLGLDKNGMNSSVSTNQEINAIDLGLNDEKVSSISSQLTQHNENKYRTQDVNENSSKSLKEFNEKFFNINYSSDVSSKRIKKYSIISQYSGTIGLRSEFIITTTDNNRYLDGRKAHFGDITSGSEVVDKIAKGSSSSITINSISVTVK